MHRPGFAILADPAQVLLQLRVRLAIVGFDAVAATVSQQPQEIPRHVLVRASAEVDRQGQQRSIFLGRKEDACDLGLTEVQARHETRVAEFEVTSELRMSKGGLAEEARRRRESGLAE